ncbi:MAG TPA: hypothetical protein VGM23_14785 [Armatimonadota bacterium]|jgi:hypothetical protein
MRETADVTYCTKHPKVVTYLKCAACGTPICPDCSVLTSVGYKCKDCGTNKNSPVYHLSPARGVAAGLVGLAAGLLAGWTLGFLGFFSIWLAFPYGRFAGGLILRASGHKLGLLMEIITGVSVTLGILLSKAIVFALRYPEYLDALRHAGRNAPAHPDLLALLHFAFPSPFGIIALVIVVATAVARIRYVWDLWGF